MFVYHTFLIGGKLDQWLAKKLKLFVMSQTRLSGLGKPDKNVLYIYLVVDDKIFFLLHEEGIKLLNLGVQ